MPPIETLNDPGIAQPGAVSEPPLAGTIRVRRSGALAGAIVFAILALATAGVMSGLNKAAAVPHRLGAQGMSIQIGPGKTVAAATAVPLGAATEPEPGSPAIGTPVGPAALASHAAASRAPAAQTAPSVIAPTRDDAHAVDDHDSNLPDQLAPQRAIDDSEDPDQAAADRARLRRLRERDRQLQDERDRPPPYDPRDQAPDPR
jgi:hypothetical protein